MERRFKFFRCLAYTIEILIFYILQQAPGLPRLLGARPVLLIGVVLTIALLEDEKMGMGFGLFAGLLMDIGSSGNALGLHAILMAVLGYFVGLLAVNLIRTNLLTAMLVTALGVFIVLSLNFVFFYLAHRYGDYAYVYQYHYLPIMLYSYLSTPVLYFFNKAFAVTIRERD